MIRGIIFDLDGVILDSLMIWQDLGIRYLAGQGIKAEPGLSEILFSMSMEQGAEYLKEHYLPQQNSREILAGLSDMLEGFYLNEVLLKKGAPELLAACSRRGIPMIAATSSPREHVTGALSRNGVLKYFREILTTSELGRSKHDPLIYQLGAERLQADPGETLVLEDSLYALQTAKAAGFRVMGVFDPYGDENQTEVERTGEAYIRDLAEVIRYLDGET